VPSINEIISTSTQTESIKLRCDGRFTHAFTACGCVFKEITLVGSNQGNFFENATACSETHVETTVATQLKCNLKTKINDPPSNGCPKIQPVSPKITAKDALRQENYFCIL